MATSPEYRVFSCMIEMTFSPEVLEKALELLVSVRDCTEAMPSCQSCFVAETVGEPSRVYYAEEWASEEAFVDHLVSKEFLRVLVAMDLCASEPRVRIAELSGREGLHQLGELRERASVGQDADW